MITFHPASIAAAGIGIAAAVWAAHSDAALAPQFNRWNEFAAVVNEGRIPSKLQSLVERIERVGEGAYRVHSDKCYVAVTLASRQRTGPKGESVFGAPIIEVAQVSEPRCG